MSDIKHREQLDREISPVDKWKHFQDNYGKKAAIGLAGILIVVLGYFAYKQFILDPKEKDAAGAVLKLVSRSSPAAAWRNSRMP